MTPQELNKFKAFLSTAGAEILINTNEYEVLRFKAGVGPYAYGIVYKKKSGMLTFQGLADEAYMCFKSNKPFSGPNQQKTNRVKKCVVSRTLLDRDGNECFFCGIQMEDGLETIEHLLSINHGGKNHIANLALSCFSCNQKASHMCIVDKVKLREKLRKDKSLQEQAG